LSEFGSSNTPNNQDEIVDDFGRFFLHFLFVSRLLPLLEITRVLVRFDHVASISVNADHASSDPL
jgi:hypothetical protein